MPPVVSMRQCGRATTGTIRRAAALAGRRCCPGGLTATDSLVCGMAEPEPGQDFARHHHKVSEVSFGLAGGGMVMVDGA